MKKILEVIRNGEFDIRFNTDITPTQNPSVLSSIVTETAFSMATKLWGGNEMDVLAIIRALAVADLSLCANRKDIIRFLDSSSESCAKAFLESQKEFEMRGGKILTFGPGITPTSHKS